MTTYRAIAASEVDPESPVTADLLTAFMNNVLAIGEGDATASGVRIQKAALANAVISRAKLDTTLVTSAYSIGAGTNITVAVNSYAFLPSITSTAGTLDPVEWAFAAGEAPALRLKNSGGVTATGSLIWRYVNA